LRLYHLLEHENLENPAMLYQGVGDYQPAQKWLKDRKGRILSFDDIRHYQKLLTSLAATAGIMAKIDEPLAP
jgi:hypothetical protein